MAGLDLTKIKNEIDEGKKKRNMVSSRLGENTGVGVAPKDEFLNGLIRSLKTGVDTPSTHLVKVIENKVSEKNKETPKFDVKNTPTPPIQQRTVPQPDMINEQERDELLWQEFERKKKQTLADSIQEYTNTASKQQPQISGNGMVNEEMLHGSVKKMVDRVLTENIGQLLDEGIKNTIIEMYAVERIKAVLTENRDLVKSLVIETIRELQSKSKKT